MAESSTNPFRKKGPASAPDDRPYVPQAASPAAFLESIASATPDGDAFREGRPVKKKVVKRVRVQSPPPVSPDSPAPLDYSSSDDAADTDTAAFTLSPSSVLDDPFQKGFLGNPDNLAHMPEAAPLVAANRGPANPFGQDLDLQEVDHDKEMATTASAPGKSALDVNAFQRLLLTGQSGAEAFAPPTAAPPAGNPGVDADAVAGTGAPPAPDSKYPALDSTHDTPSPAVTGETIPKTPQDTSNPGTEDQKSRQSTRSTAPAPSIGQKKAPPPPSSKHGKLIRAQLKEDSVPSRPSSSSSSANSLNLKSPWDVNKPLPPSPRTHDPDGIEDIFAREAAGKVPEDDNESMAATTAAPAITPGPTTGKKPTPAPPPRRGHSRSESKSFPAASTIPANLAPTVQDDEGQPRSSFDSQLSRPDSLTNKNAPAPPPRRRPSASQRQSSYAVSPPPESPAPSTDLASPFDQPSTNLDDSTRKDGATIAAQQQQQKIPPPPPPPARNPSTRRITQQRMPDATRRASGNKEREKENQGLGGTAPPPPPPRQRGSSRGSMDTPGSGPAPEEATPADPGKGVNILADLDALQREVDALRGQMRNVE